MEITYADAQDVVTDLAVEMNFQRPSDEAPKWLRRSLAWRQIADDRYALLNLNDLEVGLTVTSPAGVIETRATFDPTELGLTMLWGAVEALANASDEAKA